MGAWALRVLCPGLALEVTVLQASPVMLVATFETPAGVWRAVL